MQYPVPGYCCCMVRVKAGFALGSQSYGACVTGTSLHEFWYNSAILLSFVWQISDSRHILSTMAGVIQALGTFDWGKGALRKDLGGGGGAVWH